MARTVYIVGAGFSYPGGVPVQARLLDRVRELRVLDAPPVVSEAFFEAQATALDFITAISRSDAVPPLEDAFTILDQTIATRGFFLGYTWQKLVVVRERLQRALLVVLHAACADVANADLYRNVATSLLERATNSDALNHASVLTLNWDSVIEDAAFDVIRSIGAIAQFDINFACDTTALVSPSAHSPSLTQLARGIRSLDVVKLHGSINWLLCPNCQALFSGAGVETHEIERYFGAVRCRTCSEESPEGEAIAMLQPVLITPTFLKVFDNAHIQTAWQRAHHLLARADEVVFLGYSLPLADFHLRTLLRKAIRKTTKVTAILTSSDQPTDDMAPAVKAAFASTRFREFFGDGVEIHREGVEGYFAQVFTQSPVSAAEDSLRARIAS